MGMTQASTTQIFWTSPNTGVGIPCTVLESPEEGGEYLNHLIRLESGQEGWVSVSEIYTVDAYNRMGRYSV
jgi:hypothetical protein